MEKCRADEEMLARVKALRQEGVTWQEIERQTGTRASTWRRRLAKKPEAAGGRGLPAAKRAAQVRQIEDALLSLCLGGTIVEEKVVEETDPKGESRRVEKALKAAEPDLKAIQWWLEKRAPERWGDSSAQAGVRVISQIPRPDSSLEKGEDDG